MLLAILDFSSTDTWCEREFKLKFHAGFPKHNTFSFLVNLHFGPQLKRYFRADFRSENISKMWGTNRRGVNIVESDLERLLMLENCHLGNALPNMWLGNKLIVLTKGKKNF